VKPSAQVERIHYRGYRRHHVYRPYYAHGPAYRSYPYYYARPRPGRAIIIRPTGIIPAMATRPITERRSSAGAGKRGFAPRKRRLRLGRSIQRPVEPPRGFNLLFSLSGKSWLQRAAGAHSLVRNESSRRFAERDGDRSGGMTTQPDVLTEVRRPPAKTGLPPTTTKRWVVRRKAEVVAAVADGRLTVDEACALYSLTVDELECWRTYVERHGVEALRATRLQHYRRRMRAQSGLAQDLGGRCSIASDSCARSVSTL
jgi:hypothetical protein